MAVQKLYEVRNNTATTTDSTTEVPLVTFDTATGGLGGAALNNCTIVVTGECAVYDTVNSDAGGERLSAVFKVVAGVVTQVGLTSQTLPMADDITGTPNSDFSVAGSTITYFVTGSTGITLSWFGRTTFIIYQPV